MNDALKRGLAELKQHGAIFKPSVSYGIEFIEFDSSNPHHAAAYFLITFKGTEEDLKSIVLAKWRI